MLLSKILTGAAVGVVALSATSAAQAQGPGVDLTQTGGACVAVLAPVAKGHTASEVVSYNCYSSAEDQPLVAASNPLLGIEYKDYQYGGDQLTLYGSGGTGCGGGVTYGFGTMPSGWDNTIGSAKSYSGCVGQHYDYQNYKSASVNCTCSSMGLLNDHTSSILFHQ